MKKLRRECAAFTLVEMLVVIAIISLVALAVSRALRGAQRQANATKCLANMKNLHSGVVSYLADKGYYPCSASYEIERRWFDSSGGEKTSYHEYEGWVAWVTKKGGRRDSNGQTPWEKDSHKSSHATDFTYPANTDKIMRDAISEGALFKYVGKDYSTYKCPEHPKTKDGKPVYLAYAMNGYTKDGKNGMFFSYNERHDYHCEGRHLDKKDSSRIALFVEIDEGEDDSSSADRGGQSGHDSVSQRQLPDDCSWNCSDSSAEIGRFSHRKGSQQYSHVVFLDGHVAAIPETENPDDPEVPGWNGHANLDEVFKSLGDGTF